jgi:hypothetical protein
MKHISTVLFLIFLICVVTNPAFAQSGDDIKDSHVLNANPGPANNGGSPGWGMFLNLIASGPNYVQITGMTTASTATANSTFSIEFFIRDGNALGGPVGSGPGSSSDGWTSLGSVPVTQGPTSNGVSLLFATPDIMISPGDTAGIAMVFATFGPRYYGTGTPPYETYTDAFLTIVTGDARSIPFTPTGSFFSSRALVGEVDYNDIVPVELSSFNASALGNSISLNWITASELNNSGFQIERKAENTNWDNIGFVEGHGTTTQTQYYTFIDGGLRPGTYSYRLKQIDYNGSSKYYELDETVEAGIPQSFSLSQNFPNPFNPVTTISWQIPVSSHVTLKVYNLLGKEVAVLVNGEKPAGSYNLEFDAGKLPSGTYFYTLQAGNFVQTKKMVLLK